MKRRSQPCRDLGQEHPRAKSRAVLEARRRGESGR